MKHLLPLLSMSLAALIGVTLAGCAPVSEDAGASAGGEVVGERVNPREPHAGMGSGAPDGQFPRTVVHALGETEIPQAPERVVVIATGQMDAAVSLGVVPVGAAAGDGAGAVPDYLVEAHPDLADTLGTVAEVGTRQDPDLEAIAELAPDLILMNSAGKQAGALYEPLGEIAPTVATVGQGTQWKPDLILVADALGRAEQAQAWLDEFHAEAGGVGQGIEGEPSVSFLRRNGDRIRMFGTASFTGSIAEDIGLPRPESQRFTDEVSQDLSAEQLDQADADWIFFGVQGGDAEELTALPLWESLGAVQGQQAIQVEDDPFYLNAGPTAAELVLEELRAAMS